ncbi:MAG: alpha/beta hydrolase [Oscillospiraceae bacterium]|nr:alpha/beta hydrolase [Oscillospiraceae bacterium]
MVILIILILIILLSSYLAYRRAFYHSPKRKENIFSVPNSPQYSAGRDNMLGLIKDFDALPFEQVYITSFDGLRLAARYYHAADGAPLQIEFHGYKGTAIRDFCGGNKLARNLGQNTLVVDQRAHGKSEGKTICFGIKEKYDCLSWINYALERFGDIPIVLLGVSMGGATVLMASGLELPENVKCIVADCPYSSPEEIIRKECAKTGIPPFIGMPLIRLGALLFGNLRISGGAEEAVKNTKVPILILHGEADDFVPCDMSRKIKAANPKMVTLETFPDAAHGFSYILHTERYENKTKEFFKKVGL